MKIKNKKYILLLTLIISSATGFLSISSKTFDNSFEKHELIKSNLFLNNDIKDLSFVYIKFDKLELITNNLQSGHYKFLKVKNELNNEISKQLLLQDFNSEDYIINWFINDDEVLVTNSDIKFNIKPSGNWKAKGVYNGEFKSKAYNNLSDIYLDKNKLENITNSFEQGTNFKKIRISLEREMKNQLSTYKIPSEYLTFNWNLNDSDLVYKNTKIDWNITSSDIVLHGKNEGTFNSYAYWNLNKVNINIESLEKETTDPNYKYLRDAKPSLNGAIEEQLNSEGYPSEYIRIIWDDSNDKKMSNGEKFKFELVSQNQKFMKNSKSFILNWNYVPLENGQKFMWLIATAGSILGILVIAIIGWFSLQIFKNKKSKEKASNNKKILNDDADLQAYIETDEREKGK